MERSLSPMEEYLYWRTDMQMYSNFRVSAKYSTKLDAKVVFEALNYMVYKHSNLACNVFDVDEKDFRGLKQRLRILRSFKASAVLEIIEDRADHVETLNERLYNYYFNYGSDKEPLWKIFLINGDTILFCCDHLCFDGTSAVNFHKRFAEALEIVSKDNFKSRNAFDSGMDSVLFDIKLINNISETYTIYPSTYDIFGSYLPFSLILYEVLTHLFPAFVARLMRYMFNGSPYGKIMNYDKRHLPPPPNPENVVNCEWVHIDNDKLKSLLQLCRLHDVKLTSLLQVISLLAAKNILGDNDNILAIPYNKRDSINRDLARKLSPDFTDDFGPYIGAQDFEFPSVNKLFPDGKIKWDVVRTIHETIHHGSKRSLEGVNIFNTFSSKKYQEEFYGDLIKGGANAPASLLSNLGQLKTAGNVQIEDVWFDQQCDGHMFVLNAITSKNGMKLSLRTYLNEWLPEYKDNLTRIIDELCL